MKKAFITGCNIGIGHAILNEFLKQKYSVIACFRKKNLKNKKLIASLKKKYKNKVFDYYFDLEEQNHLVNQIKNISKVHNKIDVIINNAGSIDVTPFLFSKIETGKKLFDINLFSQILILQILIKNMIRNKKGSIINISSISGVRGDEGRALYSASKSALINLTKSLSKEIGRYNIRVNAISPGLIETRMLNTHTKKNVIEKILETLPLKRIGKPNEVAKLALFLASDDSSYITGQNIRVDGGLL
jgi:3-oxoacyl-[acyl-carrier protein] reductase